MPDSLVPIERSQWPKLRDLYSGKREFSSSYNLIQNYIDWMTQDPAYNVEIYSLNGDWKSDGTFVMNDTFMNNLFVYCNTLSDDNSRLSAALRCLDSSKKYLICGYQEHVKPAVLEYFSHTGVPPEQVHHSRTRWYHISREQALNFTADPPEGITLAPLEVRHADQVNRIWPHRSPGSVAFVETLIRFNDSVGAYDVDGNLVAWCLRLPLGALGLLQVEDSHKRRGLGNLAVRYLSKIIAAKNAEVNAPVITENVASRTMFEKLGFKGVDFAYWSINDTTD